MVRALRKLEDGPLAGSPQTEAGATYATKIDKRRPESTGGSQP